MTGERPLGPDAGVNPGHETPPAAVRTILLIEDDAGRHAGPAGPIDPGVVVLTCANCGAAMDERKCKLICRCGYFLSCSDYY